MFKNFNLYAFFVKLLPPVLRTDGVKAFLWALLSPLDNILSRFADIRDDCDRKLSHNAFTIYLEKFLNDLFELEGEIYIEDIIDDVTVCLSLKEEQEDYDTMTEKEEEEDTIILPSVRPGSLMGKFGVYIPSSIDNTSNRSIIKKWVDYYKFSGTTYIIESYE